MKTLAELKREAKSGKISGKMVARFGSNEIPERLQGVRKIVDANTVGIKFQNSDGKISELRVEAASLIEYTGDKLTIYHAGMRDLNETEKTIMNDWKKISSTEEYKEQANIDALSDGSSTYYQEKRFFENSDCPYLFGMEMKQGKKRDYSSGLIIDNAVKGNIELQYEIYHN